MDTLELIASVLGVGFFSGVRLYATVFALGASIRFGLFQPAASLESLRVLADDKVLIAAGALCLVEFLADKVPWIDSVWDTLHTFIRPVAAGLIAATALGQFEGPARAVLALLAGGVALTAHSTKAATRLAVNHTPEPFSNWVLSFAEDAAVPAGLWLVFAHPLIFLFLLVLFLVGFCFAAVRVFRLIRVQFASARAALNRWLAPAGSRVAADSGSSRLGPDS